MADPAPAPPTSPEGLRDRYEEAFREWLAKRDERELGMAYALGREAVSAHLSVMELAEAHHRATREALHDVESPEARAAVLDAAAAFLREALSTFEIAHRGYREMQQVARVEHEHVMQLRALADASVRINGAETTEATLQHTADAARDVLGVRQATVTSSSGDPYARVLNATSPPGGAGSAELGAPLGVVLRSGGRPVGMLEVRGSRERRFSDRDEAILAQLGQLAAVAIAKSEAYSRERHIAHVLQRSLLPPALPHVPGLTVAVRFIAAGEGIEVVGDFYDVFAPRPGRAAALIGDVCGKGPEAASVTALARHTLRAAAAYEPRPSAVLQLLHHALRAARDDGRFCTVAYAELEPHTRGGARMTLACGGHPLPLVLRGNGRVEPVGRLGTLLGADVTPVLTDVDVELAAGDLVIFYTDGVTEIRAGRREIFGYRDLALVLAACAGLPAEEVAQRVQDAVLDAAEGRPRDDIAVLVFGPSARR